MGPERSGYLRKEMAVDRARGNCGFGEVGLRRRAGQILRPRRECWEGQGDEELRGEGPRHGEAEE